jgi:hypothetical protein
MISSIESRAPQRVTAPTPASRTSMDLRHLLASCLAAAVLIANAPASAEESASDPSLVARGSYLANQSVAETEPDVGIIWAVPVGYSLAERDPGWQPALKCPPNDNSREPKALVAAAVQIRGKPDVNFLASDAIAQADRMLAQHPKVKPAHLANALILAYCEGVAARAGIREVEKSGALMRYGEEVIQRLQLKAEMQEAAPAARASR